MKRLEQGIIILVLVIVAVVVVAVVADRRHGGGAAAPDAIAVRENNRGVGLMGQFEYGAAYDVFQAVVDEHPGWLDVRVNLAIAALNRQKEGDEQRTLELLEAVLVEDPDHLRARYTSGVLRLQSGAADVALGHFEFVAGADPDDAYAAYYAGQALLQSQRFDAAVPWFERAMTADPYLRSATYALSQAYQRQRDPDRARAMLEEFNRLDGNPRARMAAIAYTKMGPKAEAKAIDAGEIAPPVPPQGPVFMDAAPLLADGGTYTWNHSTRAAPIDITACDLDMDGDIDVFMADAMRHGDDVSNAVLINDGAGGFRLDLDHVLGTVAGVNAALWGDHDNDGLTDVYLCRQGPNQLWRQSSPDRWENLSASTGTDNGDYDTVDGAFFDADHDGDLDIFCVNRDGPNELLNNNRDGTFRGLAVDQGLTGGSGSQRVVVADLDGDRDVDLVVLNEQAPHEVYFNDRLWQYRPAPGFDAFRAARHSGLVAADSDADGQVELLSRSEDGAVKAWTPDRTGTWSPSDVGIAPVAEPDGPVQAAAIDVTGDGRLDLVTVTPAGWSASTLPGSPEGPIFRVALEGAGALTGWAPVLLDAARGPAIVGLPDEQGPLLWAPGAGRHDFVGIALTGKEDSGQSMRSNASGIGAHVTVRVGTRWSALHALRRTSGPGQSLQPLAVGLGGDERLDFVAIDWSDGVFQSELDLASGSHVIAETQRQVSSCPVVFAWNGIEYGFVSDVLGVGGIGFALGPGEYSVPRPWERFQLPDDALAPRDGRYLIKIGEPMEEACYLDAVRLVAYTLPPGWQLVLDERMGTGAPAPTGEPRFYRTLRTATEVVNDRGENVTDRVAAVDDRAAPIGRRDPRFLGRLAREHVLTLTFDRPLDEGPGELLLVADGWVEYPYSQTVFAAWQAGASYEPPTIEARGADGRWHVVWERVGYPAGMPRRMSLPLANLPPATDALRIATNLEIYWDRLAVVESAPCPDVRSTRLPLERARLGRPGFPERTNGPQMRPLYDYARRTPFWDTRHQAGFYTRLGPVETLVGETDDAVAIFGPGEEVHLEFADHLPALEAGWTRVFVLETDGWCKDMDLYTRDGETIEPLPLSGRATPGRADLHRAYNTRFEAGR